MIDLSIGENFNFHTRRLTAFTSRALSLSLSLRESCPGFVAHSLASFLLPCFSPLREIFDDLLDISIQRGGKRARETCSLVKQVLATGSLSLSLSLQHLDRYRLNCTNLSHWSVH